MLILKQILPSFKKNNKNVSYRIRRDCLVFNAYFSLLSNISVNVIFTFKTKPVFYSHNLSKRKKNLLNGKSMKKRKKKSRSCFGSHSKYFV